MSQSPSIEEIMQRVRSNLDQRRAGNAQPSDRSRWTSPESSTFPSANTVGTLQAGLQAYDLTPLRIEIDAALEGHRRVGQLNPRNPGLHNEAIQFVKRVMLRSLTWYTRPLHHYQGAVIRAFQQIVGVLKHQGDSLQRVAQEISNQTVRIDQHIEQSARQTASVTSALVAANEKLSALSNKLNDTATQTTLLQETATVFFERSTSIEETTAALQRIVSGFDLKFESLRPTVDQESLSQALAPYSQQLAALTDENAWLRSELSRLTNELRENKLESRVRDRDLRRFFHDIQVGTEPSSPGPAPAPTSPMFPSGIKPETEFDYFLFEELYRGDESLIASRQRAYLEHFRGRQNVVDIGCGRGEFIELLRDNGISGKGVELGTDQYLLCREKALDVVQQDLFTYLESVPDESLGGLFSAQVIEHLAANDQLRFVRLAQQKTSPGSPVIFETINPECVFALVRNFFIDPTHVRPVHPETLKFAMESVKFHNVGLLFSSPMTERRIPPLKLNGDTAQLADFNRAVEGLNNLIYGFMDYAAIGWR